MTGPSHRRAPLLVPGETCWRNVRADRLALIQDAGPTFAAMAAAMEAAQHTIFIVGWDLDSRTVLRPEATDPGARTLLPLLCRCLQRRPALQVFVLIWDFSVIYSFEREPRPRRQFGRAHPRLHFSLDADHGSGGSHHQKIVVVDDAVAFVGGIDLTLHRWDVPDHPPVDARRTDSAGALYDPFHDVHAAVSGPAAAALGQLARLRWQARRRRPIPASPMGSIRDTTSIGANASPGDPSTGALGASDADAAWPEGLPVDARHIDVGLARTLVRAGQPTVVKEIEALTLAAIAAAERWIYAENQYLTSGAVTRALGLRLASDAGPEILLVLPEVESGWKEKSSMGILRDEALAYLLRKDRHRRLRLVTPTVTRGGASRRVAVHAKVLVVDDLLAKIGSANFSNRSMGLDSECDLAVEGGDPARAAFVALVRNRLLGEHLGLRDDQVAAHLSRHGSLLRLVDQQPLDAPRALIPTPTAGEAPFDFAIFEGAMVDPPEPWSASMLLERAVPVPFRRRLARRWLRPAGLAALVLAAWALLHHWDPHAHRVHAQLLRVAVTLEHHPAGAVGATLGYALASAVFVPVTLLATATLTVFGLWPGVPVAWVGGVVGALLSHALGDRLGPRAVAWIPERIGLSVRRLMMRRAFWSVVFMRLLPVGNFAALNMIAGAIKVPRRSFLLGNMVGLLPGLVGLGVVVNRLLAMLRHPDPVNLAVGLSLVAALAALGAMMKRRFGGLPRAKPPLVASASASASAAPPAARTVRRIRPPMRAAAPDLLRIATWNIHDAQGTDGRRDLARVARVIGALDAPLVGLQEVACGPTAACDVAQLATANGYQWHAIPTRGHADLQHGNALLSLLPVDDVRIHDLSIRGREPRGALEARVTWGSHRLRVVVTHLGLRAGERRHQVERLLDRISDQGVDATILLGDINEWWLWGRPLRWLHRRFGASPAVRTFPARTPLFALDRIWVHPQGVLTGVARVVSGDARRASDHLPLVATLRLPHSG